MLFLGIISTTTVAATAGPALKLKLDAAGTSVTGLLRCKDAACLDNPATITSSDLEYSVDNGTNWLDDWATKKAQILQLLSVPEEVDSYEVMKLTLETYNDSLYGYETSSELKGIIATTEFNIELDDTCTGYDGDDNTPFEIVKTADDITLNLISKVDYEEQEVFNICVKASDNAGNSETRIVPVRVVDDVVDDIKTDKDSIIIDEKNGQGVIKVSLTRKPVSDVVLDIKSNDEAEAIVAPASITFTTDNWNEEQEITISGVDDNLYTNDSTKIVISVNADSSDDEFDNLADKEIEITLTNDDVRSRGGSSGTSGSNSSEKVCKDSKALNFNNVGQHDQSLCEYPEVIEEDTTTEEVTTEDTTDTTTEEVVVDNTPVTEKVVVKKVVVKKPIIKKAVKAPVEPVVVEKTETLEDNIDKETVNDDTLLETENNIEKEDNDLNINLSSVDNQTATIVNSVDVKGGWWRYIMWILGVIAAWWLFIIFRKKKNN